MRTFFLSLIALFLVTIYTSFKSQAQADLDFRSLMKEVDSSGIFFSASKQEPSKGEADHPAFENNTFNV